MPLAVIEPRRLYRQIADQLRQLIDDGEYAVGSRLPTERELAEKLGVSRPTVREALIALEVEGRLSIRVGSGIYVIEHQPTAPVAAANAPIEGPFEILRARAFVESAVAEEAARRATPEDIARLDGVLAEAGAQKLARPVSRLDRSFHTAVAETLAMPCWCVSSASCSTCGSILYFERLARHTNDPSFRKLAHEEHVAIRDAIAARRSGAGAGRHARAS